MAVFQAPGVTTYGYQPPGSAHGIAGLQHMHATAAVSAAMGLNDTIEFGYIPNNAVVTGVILKAPTQLDSGTPSLTFDMGVTGSATLWKSAITTVGRAATVTSDSTISTAGGLYKNTTGAKQKVIATCHAAANVAVAGKLEASVSYFVEDMRRRRRCH